MRPIDQTIHIIRTRRTGPFAWILAGAFVLAAVALRLVLGRWFAAAPFITFYPAVAATTLFCGWRQGVLAIALLSIAAEYFFEPPAYSFTPINFGIILQLATFSILSALLVLLVEGLSRAVEQLDKAARMNEDLFYELQHRVANNLQIVSATLEKAARGVHDPAALEAIGHANKRIQSLARIHRQIYEAAAYSQGVEPMLRDVLSETFRGLPVDIRLEVRARDLSVREMTAITLLVNEAAINAAKHVFIPEKGAVFEVSITEVEIGRLQLIIRDDGPGIAPATTTAGYQRQRFGLTVMRGLAAQLGGSLEMPSGPGTTIRVKF